MFGAISGPANGQNLSQERNQTLRPHDMTPEPKGRNSLIDLLGIGTPFVRSVENRQSNFSPFNIFPKIGGNGDTANVMPIGIPPLPTFQSERNQNHERSSVAHSVVGSSAFGVTSKPADIQSVVRRAGNADGAFGAISGPANGQDLSQGRNQTLHSHDMTPGPKGRNSPIDLLGVGTPFVRSVENRQSIFSPQHFSKDRWEWRYSQCGADWYSTSAHFSERT